MDQKGAGSLPEPDIGDTIQEIEFDEMWHFVNEKKKSYGSGGQWIGFQTKPWAGVSAIVLPRHSEDSLKGLKHRCRFLYGRLGSDAKVIAKERHVMGK
ncbi:MAG: hypothetical protein QM669_00800 [Siphonobacter sp.]